MATYVLIHGGGGTAAGWALVADELRKRGHDVVAMDLPCDALSAGWSDYVDTVVDAAGERSDLVVVAHSAGGFIAPLVCDRLPVDLLVFVAGMIPVPGETFMQWWTNTGHEFPDSDVDIFYHDVPPDLAAADMERGEGRHHFPEGTWPMEKWPDVPAKYLLCRDDRCFNARFARRVVRERLNLIPDEMDGGHMAMLGRPEELASRLDNYWKERNDG
ncbi:MAG: alpha/beta hydrolase [Ornithinimicrobium sp.]|uniref:alpha/beta hydrolase n=1 Tax=Ornithinimicrobium sp. TaxID=1977084 RepID=UPI003D9B0036